MHKTFKLHKVSSQHPLVREHCILSLHQVSITWGLLGPSRVSDSAGLGGEPRNLHSPKFPVDALLVVQGPHFEKHCPHQAIEMCSHG